MFFCRFHAKLRSIDTPIEDREAISIKFAKFRDDNQKENLGEEQHLHRRLEEALPLIFSRMTLGGPKEKQPTYVQPKTPEYIPGGFEPSSDPLFFRTLG
jgi:hypothetical protein